MLIAELEIMFLFVFVIKDTLVTHSQAVTDQLLQHQDQRLLILVDQIHVVSMQNAEKEMEQHLVHVIQAYREIPMLNVSMNVPSTQSVPLILPVFPTSAGIHAQEFVEPMQHAGLQVIFHHVLVTQVTLETHSQLAEELQHLDLLQKQLIHAILHHVEAMQFAQKEIEELHVSASLTTLEIHMLHADLSVSSMLIALQQSNVEIFTV